MSVCAVNTDVVITVRPSSPESVRSVAKTCAVVEASRKMTEFLKEHIYYPESKIEHSYFCFEKGGDKKLMEKVSEDVLHEQISEELFERDYTIYDR